ncbi:MAG: ATP-binding cassette domain-containing protein [Oscillospiraceae bacterium]|nr:ATP-binding cassette domain-containing protein [Oscillospiraceae bacterium]
MELVTVKNLSFSYPGQAVPALRELSFSIRSGAFAVLCGPSGCGKSTLLRQLKPAVAPHGQRDGDIYFDSIPLDRMDARTQARRIGFVRQSAEHQIVTDKVWHELAFGLESLGCETSVIRRRVAEMTAFFGMEDWFYKNVTELSGGQKQLLNLASVMVMQPDLLILDEPTSQLDPVAAAEFLSVLGKINRELGTTILLTGHRLEDALPLATEVMVMDRGELICSGPAQEVGQWLREMSHPMFLAMPAPMRIWGAVDTDAPCPVTVREGREWLAGFAQENELKSLPAERTFTYPEETVIRVSESWFRYERDGADVVKGLSLEVVRGEFLALLGGNGAGKTTTLKLLAGLRKPYRGEVEVCGTVGFLPQDPKSMFVKKTVREELLSEKGQESRVACVVKLCRLEELLERHPYDLSGGEQQRLALAKGLLLDPEILLLDEPTKGLDAEFKRSLAQILQTLLDRGVTIVMVSHDVEFCARYAHRCALFFDGCVAAQGTPRDFFSGNRFYTTGANRMSRGVIEGAVTAEDVIFACGGTVPGEPICPEPLAPRPEETERGRVAIPMSGEKRKCSRRAKLAASLMLLLIPATLFAGEFWLGGRQYRVVALLLLLEMMAPFALMFEGRKPRTRELVLIACLCAIGVAGRAAFFMLPECKPVLALTVIAGVAFGGETGFLVGAVTMLCSNMLFGQGPWMPWQMFAMGIIGFLAGESFRKGRLCRSRVALCTFGALSAVLIYGGIMNPAAAVMAGLELKLGTLAAYYTTGFPVDCVHAIATWLFLWFGAEPMLEKLERIKVKYGLHG